MKQNKVIRNTNLKEPAKQLIIKVFLFCLLLISGNNLFAQDQKVSVNKTNESIEDVLKEICLQTGMSYFLNHEILPKNTKVSVNVEKVSVRTALDKTFEGLPLNYKIKDNMIIVVPQKSEHHTPTHSNSNLLQTVKGIIVDKETGIGLPGAVIIVKDLESMQGTASDQNGRYKLEKVPTGRHTFAVRYLGYEELVIPGIYVGSAKEVELNCALEELLEGLEEVIVKVRKNKPLNSMAVISARSFSVEDTRRYAGGMDDPARMVASFAGVTMGFFGDNSIIIRGNSPKGVLWKLEGVEIPSPNHFSGVNSLGGGVVTLFSSQLLAASDFYTGAFPAEFGNALSGVFDMKLRNGNNEKHEHIFQAGVLGIDIASEGPFKKGGQSSYLFNYRYSTAGLLTMLKVIPVGDQLSKYQDLSFKLNFPTKHSGTFSLWGIGGIDSSGKPEIADSLEWTYEWDRIRQLWSMDMGAAGLSHKSSLGSKAFINTTIAGSVLKNENELNRLDNNLILEPNTLIKDRSGKITLSSFINYKINAKNSFKTGVNFHALIYNLEVKGSIQNDPFSFASIINESGKSFFTEYFLQLKHEANNKLSVLPGLALNYFNLNSNISIDPRLSIKWNFHPKHGLGFGFGKHSQRENLKIYFIQKQIDDQIIYPNGELGLSQALHFVAGYNWTIRENMHLILEPYYQYLYNIPGIPDSSYSMINFKQDWTFRNSLENNCIGINKGIDVTFEKSFNKNYYWLFTASVFDSKYKADDGIWRNTRYNKQYVLNILAGKEFFFKNNAVFGINAKINLTGGERISPVMHELSKLCEEVIYDESNAFEDKLPGVEHLDITLTYRRNKPNYAGIWALQVKNILAEPYGGWLYNYKTKQAEINNTVIILPVLSYKIEF